MNNVIKKISLQEIERIVLALGSDDLATFGGSYQGGIHCQQVPDEIAACIHAIIKSGFNVRSYLEIGSAAGGTAYLFNRFFNLNWIVLIDDNKHPKAALRSEVLAGIMRWEIIGNSADESIVQKASVTAPYDIIMIDGDHSLSGVMRDVACYRPMLQPGGWMILHDSAVRELDIGLAVRWLRDDNRLDFAGEFLSRRHVRPLGLAVFRSMA